MKPHEFYKQLEKEDIKPVYLFKGEADFLMEEAWNRLIEKLVPPKARRFNGERLSARECVPEQLIERLSTLPMFGSKSIIMVHHIEEWVKDQRKTILSYLKRPNPASCLVLVTLQKKSDMEEAAAATGAVVEFLSPTERDAPQWLQERAAHHGKSLTSQAASLLMDQVGIDLYLLERELEKLAIYIGDRKRIEAEDVKQIVGLQRSFSVFELLNHIGLNQRDRAMSVLQALLLSGEAPLGILALLARQIRILWQIKVGLDQGLPHSQMGQKIGLAPFVIKKYVQQASLFSEKELHKSHQALRAADLALKSTGISPAMILQGLIFSLCRSTQKSP